MRLLSKSRFKLGLECPNKLYFSGNKKYANHKSDDTFLKSLAQGGFQVEELAREQYAGGVLVDTPEGEKYDHQKLWQQTQELLKLDDVIIYEPAFLYNDLFIRVDILVKKGNRIQLIEVKAKSYNPLDKNTFVGKKGGIVSSWKPYLYDVAFQNYVMKKCFPKWEISNYLMLADKTKVATIDGLNQMFRARENTNNRTGIVKKYNDISELGQSVLGKINIDDIVTNIQINNPLYFYSKDLAAYSFEELISTFSDAYKKNEYLGFPPMASTCKKCEFKTTAKDEENGLKSGYKYCFKNKLQWQDSNFEKALVSDIWNIRPNKLFEDGKYFMDDLEDGDIKVIPEPGRMSASERKWIQVEKVQNNDNSVEVFKDDLKIEMGTWNFPLHFIDFETSMAALPFNKGRHPYEQIAFQFSHHVMYEDGTVEHKSEYINTKAGVFPNFIFLRALKKALDNDSGTIFKFAPHENTVLNQIYVQLKNSNEADKAELMSFIESVSHSKKDSAKSWTGSRDMVDLNKVVKDYYYNPLTKGSNSIKAILPAVLQTSKYIQGKYSKSIGELGISSKNFDKSHSWLEIKDGEVQDPYKILPPVFDGWSEDELQSVISDMDYVKDGGAALTAYGKLQYTDMSNAERESIAKSLLKYCELDTMAMVMIYEHLREVAE